ncbi:MAG: nuclear transport factor 2 family protein [Marinibacterium sp.]|nr:nuclear transport factor 2 family protein [Marinibacterium sp.]
MNEDLLAELFAVEPQVWDALAKGDQKVDAVLMNEEFLGVYQTGFTTWACHVGQLDAEPTVASYKLADFTSQPLGRGHALLAYRTTFLRPGGPAQVMYVSSI